MFLGGILTGEYKNFSYANPTYNFCNVPQNIFYSQPRLDALRMQNVFSLVYAS